jgi:hypothetical protein
MQSFIQDIFLKEDLPHQSRGGEGARQGIFYHFFYNDDIFLIIYVAK